MALHDRTVRPGKEILKIMGKRLVHMHVSGCTKNEIHWPVHAAENRKAIERILKLRIDVPKIVEDVLLADFRGTVRKELAFLNSFEKE